MNESLTVSPTRDPRVFRGPDGAQLTVPAGWTVLPPGDAGLTRRVKSLGPSWMAVEVKGRKKFSQGLWAPAENIVQAQAQLEAERADPAYQKRLDTSRKRREKEQAAYVAAFEQEVSAFLAFSPTFAALQSALSLAVTALATPVGSGTVARTERISIECRAEAAVIAWMRHQTTAYDDMHIARVKGARRGVRRQLAEISRAVLDLHRISHTHLAASCPLCRALPDAAAQAATQA